ncbi:hypothetical protein [Archangium sp.]|jgi:hypothetical protein|uniref:hypothetical protein n=1 Tax=Archangium sp. TaxID=1872627 RepID=UPI002EDA12D5
MSLRLPLLAMLGAMTMGSGLGNPGCGSSGNDSTPYVPPVCDGTCDAMAGTYRLSFQSEGPLGADCDKLGMKLPAELEFSRNGDTLKGTVSRVELTGAYYPGASQPPNISLAGEKAMTLADGRNHLVRVSINGQFKTVPASTQEPSTFTGTYYAFRIPLVEEPEGGLKCDIVRMFTATRTSP